MKGIKSRNNGLKNSLLADNMIVYIENPKLFAEQLE